MPIRTADAPWRREDRIVAAGEGERIVGAPGAAELAKDVVRQALAHLSVQVFGMIRVSSAISTSGQVMCGLWLASIS